MNAPKSYIPGVESGVEKRSSVSEPVEDYLQFYGLNDPSPQVNAPQATIPQTNVTIPPPFSIKAAPKFDPLKTEEKPPENLPLPPSAPRSGHAKNEDPKQKYKLKVAMQRCFICNGPDFRHLEVCVNCGFEKRNLLATGKYQVYLDKNADRKLALEFFRSLFANADCKFRAFQKRQLLVSYVSKAMVQVLQATTANAGFTLEIKEQDFRKTKTDKILRLAIPIATCIVLGGLAWKNLTYLAFAPPILIPYFYWLWIRKQSSQPVLPKMVTLIPNPKFALKSANLSSVFNNRRLTKSIKDDLCQLITEYFHLHEYIRKDKPFYARHLEKMVDRFANLALRIEYMDSQIKQYPEKKSTLESVVGDCETMQKKIRAVFADMVSRSMQAQPIFGPEDMKKIHALDL